MKHLPVEQVLEWDKEADKVYMTGPAKVVFDGEIDLTDIDV